MKICICACQYYERTPREKTAAVLAACRAAQMPSAASATSCEIVQDLCFIAAKDRGKLENIASCDVVLACQPRAVRALLSGMGNAKCIDLRAETLEDILAALSLTPIEVQNAECRMQNGKMNENHPQLQIPNSKLTEDYSKLQTLHSAFCILHSTWKPWFPVIDAERCTHCRKCVDFCMFGVYAVEAEKVCVIKPESCKTDCPACARVCPQNAIMFPKSEDERLNGSLAEPIRPSADDKISFRERLKHRKSLRLFKEDEP